MLIWFLLGAIALIILINNHFRRFRDADEKTLRPMSEWIILANSGSTKHRERMSYSLIIQAATILEGLNVLPQKSLSSIMNTKPDMSKSNFVLFVLETASELCPNEFNFLEKSFINDQARKHLAINIELILKNGGASALTQVILSACSEPVD